MSDVDINAAMAALLPHDLTFGWEGYYCVVLWSDLMQVLTFMALALAGARAVLRRIRRPSGELLTVREPVSVIVPCYLPNEAPIIEGTVRHLLQDMRHVEHLTVYLVYNTPKDMPKEEEALRAMAEEQAKSGGPHLHVRRVAGSTSKAENLNDVVKDIDDDYIAIYDADHHPDPESLALAIWHLRSTGADCVQGSTYIRQGLIPFRWFVCAEFFVNYFVVLPAMQVVSGTGFFGGANGIWRGSSLRSVDFDKNALTEDIDCFARSVVNNNFKFVFMPECCSGELLPGGFKAFWRQRLRWAMGWDQVTLRHATAFWTADVPWRRRLGLCYIFFCRWLSQFCAVIIVIFNAKAAISFESGDASSDESPLQVPGCIRRLQFTSFCFYIVFIGYAVLYALFHSPLSVLPGLVIYFTMMPVYVLFNSVMLMISLFRVTTGSTGEWVVTSRATGVPSAATSEPLLGPKEGEFDQCSRHIILIGFMTLGGVAGTVIGGVVGTHQEVHPLFGFVPFGIGATVTSVTDGRIVGACLAGGMFIAAVFFEATMMVLRQRRRDAEAR